VQRDPAAERLGPVPEPDQARAATEVRAATPVVVDADSENAVAGHYLDLGGGSVGVLGRVGQRFGDHVVRGDLNRLRRSARDLDVQVNWNGAAANQPSERRTQPALRQRRRVDAAGDLAQFRQRGFQAGAHAGQPRR